MTVFLEGAVSQDIIHNFCYSIHIGIMTLKILLFISIAHKVLAEIHAHEEEAEEKARQEALPQPKGLERLRRHGSSVDFRHARRWSSRAAFPGASVPEEIDGY